MEYGREYCVNVDKAVYEGFCEDFVCTPNVPTMSWGGKRCEFDWGQPLTEEDLAKMNRKKQELGTSAMRDFDYHTAHIYYTITDEIQKAFPESADEIIFGARTAGLKKRRWRPGRAADCIFHIYINFFVFKVVK